MTRFSDWRSPTFDEKGLTHWNWMCQHPENATFGRGSDVGAFCYLNAKNGLRIEEDVQLGSHCSVYTLSTIDNRAGPVVLKRNCRIGAHSTILPGVTVGENSVVGAHSLVSQDIPPNVLAVGVPAKVVRKLVPGEFDP